MLENIKNGKGMKLVFLDGMFFLDITNTSVFIIDEILMNYI